MQASGGVHLSTDPEWPGGAFLSVTDPVNQTEPVHQTDPVRQTDPVNQTDSATVPTGTVTFLFTDIEGSTRLLEQLRQDYATLLAEQRHLLRAAFAEWNGF